MVTLVVASRPKVACVPSWNLKVTPASMVRDPSRLQSAVTTIGPQPLGIVRATFSPPLKDFGQSFTVGRSATAPPDAVLGSPGPPVSAGFEPDAPAPGAVPVLFVSSVAPFLPHAAAATSATHQTMLVFFIVSCLTAGKTGLSRGASRSPTAAIDVDEPLVAGRADARDVLELAVHSLVEIVVLVGGPEADDAAAAERLGDEVQAVVGVEDGVAGAREEVGGLVRVEEDRRPPVGRPIRVRRLHERGERAVVHAHARVGARA